MLSDAFAFGDLERERSTLMFIGVLILVGIINSSIIIYDVSLDGGFVNPDQVWDVEYESTNLVFQESMTLNDGELSTITQDVEGNWSDDGWMISSILVTISYDETAFADADCDTVRGVLQIDLEDEGEIDSEVTENEVSDCSDLNLELTWTAPPSNSSVADLDVVSAEMKLGELPGSVELEVSLNVDSTIPANDNDEQINVEIQVNLLRATGFVAPS